MRAGGGVEEALTRWLTAGAGGMTFAERASCGSGPVLSHPPASMVWRHPHPERAAPKQAPQKRTPQKPAENSKRGQRAESPVADRLVVRGAREHNLKDISIDLPRDALIVFTGLSGSGKSSLAFDTIFAEGQRRYVESLSAYARQFLGQMDKPDVDFIDGLSPAVSIDQKAASRNPRSTVGTITEIYDYMRLLYARVGKPHCPICGRPIARQSPQQIVDRVLELAEGTRFQVLAPVVRGRKGEYADLLRELQTKGYSRARVDGQAVRLDSATGSGSASELPKLKKYEKHDIEVIVDRLAVKDTARRRLTDSVETALACPAGSSCSNSWTCPTTTRTASGCIRSTWPACTTTCRSTSWSRARSRSTPRGVPARSAPASAPGWRSTRS